MKKNNRIKKINNFVLLITGILILSVIYVLFQYEFNLANEITLYSENEHYILYDIEKYYELEEGDSFIIADNTNKLYDMKLINIKEHVQTNDGMVYQYTACPQEDTILDKTTYYLRSKKKTLLEFILSKYL